MFVYRGLAADLYTRPPLPVHKAATGGGGREDRGREEGRSFWLESSFENSASKGGRRSHGLNFIPEKLLEGRDFASVFIFCVRVFEVRNRRIFVVRDILGVILRVCYTRVASRSEYRRINIMKLTK